MVLRRSGIVVSIPFKRETSSKLVVVSAVEAEDSSSFNSLQTGNFFQTSDDEIRLAVEKSFQFPSNGKLLPNYDERGSETG